MEKSEQSTEQSTEHEMVKNVVKNVVKKIIKEHLTISTRIEFQRITKGWFKKNNIEEWDLFKDINTPELLYCYLTGDNGLCGCSVKKRFISYSKGYKEFCSKCSRTKNNFMIKKSKSFNSVNDVTTGIENDEQFQLREKAKNIMQKLKTQTGKFSSTKILKLSTSNKNIIISTTFYLNTETQAHKFSERLYHIENNLTSIPKCCCVAELDNFISSVTGYSSKYCKKNKCSYKHQDRTTAKLNSLKYFYEQYNNNYLALNDSCVGGSNGSSKLYSHRMFAFSEYSEFMRTKLEQSNQLTGLDIPSVSIKHLKCGTIYTRHIYYQGHLKCPKCYPIRSRVQYEIFEWLNGVHNRNAKSAVNVYKKEVFKFNDRQLLKPKEIDILASSASTYNFGIEYDSINYHSTGFHNKKELNNTTEDKFYHVQKTNACEKLGYQLFRIFSNEWVHKQDIWKSILSKAMGTRCASVMHIVKIIPDEIKEINAGLCNEFLENNDLEGAIKTTKLIRLGAFYKNELIQVLVSNINNISTCNTDLNNSEKYKIERFCTKIGSDTDNSLFKYFEHKYNPGLIICSLNRRWNTGKTFEKMGFKKISTSEPNYFYFKGDDKSKFISVHQIRKDLNFVNNSELSETENMYNNGYRKIYDCGNITLEKT